MLTLLNYHTVPYLVLNSPITAMKTISNDIFFAQVEELLAEGQSVVIRVKGYSMRPFMRSERTQVRIAPITESERQNLRVGDVVLFRYKGRHIMHRIRRIAGEKITLAGDGNYRIWEDCRHEDIVGIISDVIGFNGRSISCQSRHWRCVSWLWVSLPQLVRRAILGILWRIGIK